MRKFFAKAINSKYIEVKSPRIRALLEALTAGMLCPAHIGTGEKRID